MCFQFVSDVSPRNRESKTNISPFFFLFFVGPTVQIFLGCRIFLSAVRKSECTQANEKIVGCIIIKLINWARQVLSRLCASSLLLLPWVPCLLAWVLTVGLAFSHSLSFILPGPPPSATGVRGELSAWDTCALFPFQACAVHTEREPLYAPDGVRSRVRDYRLIEPPFFFLSLLSSRRW